VGHLTFFVTGFRASLSRLLRNKTSAEKIAASLPAVPSGTAVYAVGDIHGEITLLRRMLDAISADASQLDEATRRVVVFLGDYVDRGPASAAVISLLESRPLAGFEHHFLKGNHEQAFLSFLENPSAGRDWLGFGGIATADSYGSEGIGRLSEAGGAEALALELERCMPEEHSAFLGALELCVTIGDYFFSHAGIRPQVSLERQDPEDLLWIREPFLSWRRPHPKIIVHGHSIEPAPQLGGNRIGVDTGAYATGLLSAVVLHEAQQRILQVKR
jgi:serine/threonine protein phosphatase 1